MPHVTSGGVRLHCEVVGDGPPLVLHPAYIGCTEDWVDDGYVAALQDHYQLILLDPLGQGQSDTPHNPAAYATARRVQDVIAVLDAVGIDRAHYWSYSMGGRISFAFGAQAPDRLRSLILGGAHPFAEDTQPAEGDFWLDHLRQGMGTLVEILEEAFPEFWQPPGRRERWLTADPEALAAAQRQMLTEPGLAEETVAAIAVPALLYAGTRDDSEPVERAARLMPNAAFVALEGLDHVQAYTRRDLILPHVLEFLAWVDTMQARPS